MRHLRSPRPDCAWHLCLAPLVLALCLPMDACGQLSRHVDFASATQAVDPDRSYPDYRKRREITLSGVGAGLLVAGRLLHVDNSPVPAEGFDPTEIAWSVDRDIVGNNSLDADAASDWTRTAALVFPLALALATGQQGERWLGLGRRSLLYAETLLIGQGISFFGKATLGRARPFAYVPEEQRPDDLAYDVSRERTFHSMPSGHSSSAWTGAALGMTEHLLSRPQASWVERVGVGLLGGAFAGMTSALRVEAGQHFPSDVLVGAGIGIATGVTVPLLHRGDQPLPSSRSWAQTMGGALAGTLLGVLVAQGY